MPGHGKSRLPVFGNPIGSKGPPRIGAVNHLSIANRRWRSVCTNENSPSTDACTISSGSCCARSMVSSQSAETALHAARIPSGSVGSMSARCGSMRASSALTYAVTSTPLIRTPLNIPSMSTSTNHTWDIFTFVRLAPSTRAPVRSTSRNCAPRRSAPSKDVMREVFQAFRRRGRQPPPKFCDGALPAARLRALARGGFAALAPGRLVLGGGPALLRIPAGAGLLAAPLRRAGRVGDLGGAFLRHALFLERLVLLRVLHVRRLRRHRS